MESLSDTLSELVCRRDDRTTLEYCSSSVELFPPITRTGKFRVEESRHFIAPIEALDDGRTREVNLLKPVRGGGSLIGDLHISSVLPVSRNPGPYLVVRQTDNDARMHFMDRTLRMFEGNEQLRGLLPDRYKWEEIPLTNGHTLYTGGPGISNLQSKGVRYLMLDECWFYPQGMMGEAEARVGDFLRDGLSKILRISQGGPNDGVELVHDDWNRAYHRGSIHEWESTCINCGRAIDPIFSGTRADGSFWGITWDQHKFPNSDWNIPKCQESVRFECPHCGQPSMDTLRTKSEWNRMGRYRLVGEDNIQRKSFHWEAVISYPWDFLVGKWLEGCNAERRGNLKPKLQFYQKFRAMFKDEAALMRSGMTFIRSPYKASEEWPDEKSRYLIFDRQEEDKYWWMARAWSSEETRRLGFGTCFGESGMIAIQQKYKVPPNHVGVDSGYLPKGDHGVYAICARNGWIALKGDKMLSFPHWHRNRKTGQKYQVLRSYAPISYGDAENGLASNGRRYIARLLRFSKARMNQVVRDLIASGKWKESETIEDPEMEKELAAQMSSRMWVVQPDPKTGEVKGFWKEGANDHACDLSNGQALFAIVEQLIQDPATAIKTDPEKKEENEAA